MQSINDEELINIEKTLDMITDEMAKEIAESKAFVKEADEVLEEPKVTKEKKPVKPRGRPRKHPIKVKSDTPRKPGRPRKLEQMYVDGELDRRAYYLNNRDRIKERISKKIVCDVCGSSIRYDNLTQHKRTNICKKKGGITS